MNTNSYFRRPFWRVTAWPYCSTSLLCVIWTIPKHRINDRLCMCGCVVAGNGGDIQQVWAHPLGRLPLLNILTQRTVSNSIISTALSNCLNYVKTEPDSIKIKKFSHFLLILVKKKSTLKWNISMKSQPFFFSFVEN